jgi:hypothetical protein
MALTDYSEAHNAGPDYPAYAQLLVGMVKAMYATPDPTYIDAKKYRRRSEGVLAKFLDEHRAACANVIPNCEIHPIYAYETVLSGDSFRLRNISMYDLFDFATAPRAASGLWKDETAL